MLVVVARRKKVGCLFFVQAATQLSIHHPSIPYKIFAKDVGQFQLQRHHLVSLLWQELSITCKGNERVSPQRLAEY